MPFYKAPGTKDLREDAGHARPNALSRGSWEGSAEEVFDDTWDGGEGVSELGLVFAAGFGDFGFAAAGAADEFGDCADELAGLDAFGEARGDAGDDGDFAFRLGAAEDDDAFGVFLG